MKIVKTVAVWLLLLSLTAALVILPPYVNERSVTSLVGEKTPWSYDGNPAVIPDSATVARQYATGAIQLGTFSFADNDYSSMDAHDSAMLMIDTVFGDQALHRRMDRFSVVDILFFEHDMGIMMYKERPVVLSFVTVEFQYSDTTTVQMLFEEKTDTLLSIAYTCKAVGSEEAAWIETTLLNTLQTYYDETLGLDKDEAVCGAEWFQDVLFMHGGVAQAEKDAYAYVTEKEML